MQKNKPDNRTMEVGVARIDITPSVPMRLSGFAARPVVKATETLHKLSAKALALGSDSEGPSIIITVDLLGVQWRIASQVMERISAKTGIDPAQIVIAASHTHGSPETGNLINVLQCRGDYPTRFYFSDRLLDLDELIAIAEYNEDLINKLEEVALVAWNDRQPAWVAWGQGQADFGVNRITPGGAVDNALPVLRVTSPEGVLRAVLLNYATHGITYGPDVDKFHGDWMGEAQLQLEAMFPGAVAMVAIGCAGDSHPAKQGKAAYVTAYGSEIAMRVKQVLESPMTPLVNPPVGKMTWVELPFGKLPTTLEWIERAKTDKTIKGYYARLALERLLRGGQLPTALDYPIQTWAFGEEMVMINMANEVVAEYALRLKHKFRPDRMWINTYANDVSCYIASRRLIKAGGYEGDVSMYWYHMPAPFAEEVEDIVLDAIDRMMPHSFKK
ncbi:hypothetical protein [Parapedobacter soli]|uniref:hypothetical protein n=1 Tax=Parapedobacter soli TaxID=416955 RepID=UPI0021C74F23|nr:hypothetical protein [Parapedobacter soli]